MAAIFDIGGSDRCSFYPSLQVDSPMPQHWRQSAVPVGGCSVVDQDLAG